MANTRSLKKVYIDALPIAVPNLSGIGHAILSTVKQLDQSDDFLKDHEIILLASGKRLPFLKEYGFKNVQYKSLIIKPKIINGLNRYGLLPPVDLFLGRGTYVFGNFTTWPLRYSKGITYIHDIGYERFPQFAKPKVYKALHKNVPKWVAETDAVVTVSEHAKTEIHDFYGTPLDKITVVPNGVDRKVFYPRNEGEIMSVRKSYGLDKPYVLFLSNLEPRKNLARLIEAYSKLNAELLAGTTLLLVGSESWQSDEIDKALALARGRGADIRRPEHYVPDADLPALMSGAKILAHPAIYEGFGISVLQAMACGTPVLVSRSSSLPEVAGDAAQYVDCLDVVDIANKLEGLLQDDGLRTKLGSKGLGRSQKFTWAKSSAKLQKLIRAQEQ